MGTTDGRSEVVRLLLTLMGGEGRISLSLSTDLGVTKKKSPHKNSSCNSVPSRLVASFYVTLEFLREKN